MIAAGRHELQVDVTDVRRTPSPSPRVVLVQALLKGDRGELAVELATEVGVDVIVPWNAERCIVRWDAGRGAKHLDRWRHTAIAAAKQSRRDWWPVVEELASTDGVAERLRGAALPLVLHESGTAGLSDVAMPPDGDLVLVVGPEGGIADTELARLVGPAGPVYRLGNNVFRGSSAGAFAVAALSSPLGRWR